MSETLEEEPIETLTNTNNFYTYLPGGWLRDLGGANPEQQRLMAAIDQLLQDEFSDINGAEIAKTMAEANQSIAQAFNDKGSPDQARAQFKAAEEKLRPLFNRLLELGFDADLMRG
ncbi:MAG: hypothetical protein PHW95_03245 [Patescibacteria group bacterium]|nr:hypothetical protein [Patescibacteria group bacterium]